MSQYFSDELAVIKANPNPCIIAIGSMPAKILCNVDKVKHERGTIHNLAGIPVVITLEPAGLIWSKSEAKNIGETRDYLPIVIKDLVKVKRLATGHASVSVTRELVPHAKEADCEDMLDRIEKSPEFGLDVETNYPQGDGKTITMIGLSDKPGRAVTFMPWAFQRYRERIQKILADKTKKLVGWNNAQFDKYRLIDNGWVNDNLQFDCMLADHLVESDMGDFSLEGGASRHLDYEPWKHLTTKDPMRNCLDVSITLEMAEKMKERMDDIGCTDLFWEKQVPMADLCATASRLGIRVDKEAMAKAYVACESIIQRYDKTLTETLGPIFNRKSPKQLATLFYEVMKLPIQLHRRTRKPTTDHYALDDLTKIVSDPSASAEWKSYKPVLEALGSIKQFDKMLDTFLSGSDLHPDGRWHPSFLQHRQVTGRLSAQDPNVMQLPQGLPRAMVLPDHGDWVIIKVDYSQIQMRLGAWFSSCAKLMERCCARDLDPTQPDAHTLHAQRFYGDTEITKTHRSLTKNMYYGIQFGQRAAGLATMYGVEQAYAQRFIDFIWSEYPELKRWRDGLLNTVEERNYLKNPYHRVRWLWNRNFATEAFICLPQMTEFDMMAESALELAKLLPSPARQLMWVHDEIVVTCPETMAEEVSELMGKVMSRGREKLDGFGCPTKATIGRNYDEASREEGLAGDWRRLRRTVR
jgi:DNA polymerase I-like protein with 3'-5' exonuclease and polymerase domains